MSHLQREATKGLDQGDLALDEQIRTPPCELCVLLLLQGEDHVACLCIWVLVCHAPELHFVVFRRPFLDVHFEHLSLWLRGENSAVAATILALAPHLLDHGPQANGLHCETSAITLAALL